MNNKITPSNFSIIQVSEHGTSNPIIARLLLQMWDLFALTKFPEEKQKEIQEKLYALGHKLLKCYDIHQNFTEELNKEIGKIKPYDPISHTYYNPYMRNLEVLSENFLYHAKNYLRDLGHFLNLFHPDLILLETPFSTQGKKNIFDTFLSVQKPELSSVFQKDKEWINEIIMKRNAVEHPGGHSGKLHIVNFQITQAHEIIHPVWYREMDGKRVSPVAFIMEDMVIYLENLLTFSEDIIIHFCIKNNFCMKGITIYEIPEEKRDKKCPIRLKATLAT